MTNEKMREEFEKWWNIHHKGALNFDRHNDIDYGYTTLRTRIAWISWQASRENIEVELPSDRYSVIDTFDTDGNLEDSGIYSSSDGEFYKVKEVEQKLTEQGFKVK
ncbi:hypothetical protein [Arsenophonus nasoniae]|uniref:Uncharacterized protein n=1 Tax=Arsenophonus nasoniae TaxID=638 RepID=A0AA95GDD0_9GAMM|nr:hypothetical protein [Arsenophonus nasoniae]WGL95964.1 hypothetical protein QE207_05100 [Arsenophonus nasoniae]WGL96702.1 hypothetical protein QE207_09305 [Arsenophonus nasoniae]